MDFFSYTFSSDDHVPEDDIDKLFNKLEPVAPPSDLIKRILSDARRMPKPRKPPVSSPPSAQAPASPSPHPADKPDKSGPSSLFQMPPRPDHFQHLDSLVVRNENREPS